MTQSRQATERKMILDSLLAGTLIFGSFSMRTANVQPNPDDYEVSFGISKDHIHLNRQYERELGAHYIDDLVWIKLGKDLYIKPEYMNKESKNIRYGKIDYRMTFNDMTYGLTTRTTEMKVSDVETFASFGITKKTTYFDKLNVEATFDGYVPYGSRFEFEDKFKVSWNLTDKINLYNLGEFSRLKGSTFYKAKIGIEYKL